MNALTRQFLADAASAPPDPGTRQAISRLFGTEHLTRPVFLNAAQLDRLGTDLPALYDLLAGLPERLAGGDLDRWAALCHVTGRLREAVRRTAGDRFPVARADLYQAGERFRLLEMNTIAVGCTDIGELATALARVPSVGRFVRERGLAYTDPMPAVCAELRAAARRRGCGERPRVAVLYPPGEPTGTVRTLELLTVLLGDHGIPAVACDLSQVRYERGALRAAGRPVDLAYRFFLLESLAKEHLWRLAEPVIAAHERGDATLVAPFTAELFGSKRALALPWHAGFRDLFTVAERALFERLVPWSQVLGPDFTAPDGGAVDPVGYCERHRTALVFKPGLGQGGRGVLLGDETPPDRWAAAIRRGLARRDVVQHRIRPDGEDFVEGRPPRRVRRTVNWGVFVVGGRYAGAVARAAPAGAGDLVAYRIGAQLGCCYEQRAVRG